MTLLTETHKSPSSRASLHDARIGLVAFAGSMGGPRTYARELLTALLAEADTARWHLLTEDRTYFGQDEGKAAAAVHLMAMRHKALRPLWERRLPRASRELGLDLLHGTKNSIPNRLSIPSVVTIHDLAPFLMPETFPRLSGLYLRRSIANGARRATRVIAVSRTTADDVERVLNVPRSRIDVIHHGLAPDYRAKADPAAVAALRTRLEIEGPLILCVGTVQPRKNQLAVLTAFRSVQQHLPAGTTCLFVGRPGWKVGPFAAAHERHGSRYLRWMTRFRDEDLPALYAAADLFVSPSDYEGFGLTFLEAMSQTTPVISLSRGAAPEVIGSTGILLPSPDPDDLGQQMRELFADTQKLEHMGVAARERAHSFTWSESARKHLQSYANALSRHSGSDDS